MAALSQGQSGALRIGTFQSVGAKVLPEVMRRFLAAWPLVELELSESTSDDDLLRLVERGELDLAFAMLPTLEGPFESEELLRDRYVLVVPAEHELASLTRASIADLGDLTLIGNRACRSTALAEGELVQRGVRLDVELPLGRQRNRARAGRSRVRRRARPAAHGRPERRRASPCWSSTRRSRTAGSRSPGTATGTARRPRARSRTLLREVCAEVEASLAAVSRR